VTQAFVETGTVLDRILAQTARDVAARKLHTSIAELERRAADRTTPVSLLKALSTPTMSVIAEFKRASPSKGRFPVVLDPDEVAKQYLSGGAAALSVLTDEPFFEGSMADLTAAAAVAHSGPAPAPVLRKDFIVDEFQIFEALAIGADAILLIVAALEQTALVRFSKIASELGLSVLVEVHDEIEMARAIDAGAQLIGVNNRDLRTFAVDLAVTERLAPLAPPDSLVVGESGIFTAADVARLADAGAQAVLVGESLIVSADRGAAIQSLLQTPR
jgi:indole-3-glycerol phosphate synthase